ncbi:hypothetical protein [Oceanirhabdus sp. W0125-5]|uniref:hypothetical protein n=1 Tax=Oceanirhabdus sp. W0125-5 TaxID=2999116 RepID=UPI0022F2C753|nr:hypothetical protein [Oceanirhabdus sp. W0125-5]WBW95242.1 hypothetical protein OW730_16285 [Oceanirhabdus sp. W0125-5]
MKVGIDIGIKKLYSDAFEGRNDIIMWDVQQISNEQLIKVKFIKTNSNNKQGIWIATDKGIEVNGNLYSQINLWEDTSPKEVILKCYTDVGLLSIYNIWDKGRGRNSQSYTSGMIIKEIDNVLYYYCNDYGFETDFNKLIFSIEKL